MIPASIARMLHREIQRVSIYEALGHAFCKRYHIRSFTPIKDGEMINSPTNAALTTSQ